MCPTASDKVLEWLENSSLVFFSFCVFAYVFVTYISTNLSTAADLYFITVLASAILQLQYFGNNNKNCSWSNGLMLIHSLIHFTLGSKANNTTETDQNNDTKAYKVVKQDRP